MTSPSPSRIPRRLSKRISRDLGGNLKPKTVDAALVEKNHSRNTKCLSSNTKTEDFTLSSIPTVQRTLLKRASWYPKGKAKGDGKNLASNATSASSSTEIRDSPLSKSSTLQRTLSKRASLYLTGKAKTEKNELIEENLSDNATRNSEIGEFTSSKSSTVQHTLSKRISWMKTNEKSDEVEPVEKNLSNNRKSLSSNTKLKDSTSSKLPIAHHTLSNRSSSNTKGKDKVEEVDPVHESFPSNAEIEDPTPPNPELQPSNSKRVSRDIKGKGKAEKVEPVQNSSLVSPEIEDPRSPNTATLQRRPSRRVSWAIEGVPEAEEAEPVQKMLFTNSELEHPIPSQLTTIQRRSSKRVSWAVEGTSIVEGVEPVQYSASVNAETEDPTLPPPSRRTSIMKSSKDIKGKGKAKEDEPLFGNVEIEDYDAGYLTIRDPETKEFVSYAHGEEVMRGDEWGFIHTAQPPETSASVRRYQQVKHAVAESTRSLACKLDLPVGKGKGKETESAAGQHNPYQVYGYKPTKLERVVENSEMLTNLVDSVKRLNIFKKYKPPHRVWDRRGQEEDFEKMRWLEIMNWTEDQIEEYNEHILVALTTQQLKELQGKSADGIIYANPVYADPPGSPTDGQYEEEELAPIFGDGEAAIWGSPEDDDPEAEYKYIHKDLRKLLGPYKGFHVAPGTASKPEIFDQPENLSDYYGMPLVETGRNHKFELIGLVNLVEQEYQRAGAEGSGDYGYENRDPDEVDSASSDYDQTLNVLCRPRSQLPGQALMIYLLYSGFSIDDMAKVLRGVDETFLYESDSRWWKGYRIPQHTQFTELIAEKTISITPAAKEWWEEEFDPEWSLYAGKKIPEGMKIMKYRMRARKLKYFAMAAVENYLWWRLLGQQPHKDIKSGPLMRKGEY
jgi:hypothetical protein